MTHKLGLRPVKIIPQAVLRTLICALFCGTSALYAQNESKLDYSVTLADAAHHRVHVSMSYNPEDGGTEVQLPVWNALYQIRDFSRNVIAVKASSESGDALAVRQVDKTTWEVRPTGGWVTFDYDIILDDAGPFGAQFNSHHAFFNLAEVLMYPTAGREMPIALRFVQAPAAWKLATPLPSTLVPFPAPEAQPSKGSSSTQPTGKAFLLHAPNYDRLVDSPCELGEFAESDFTQGGAQYRVVIDAEPADFNAGQITDALKKITAAETAWMNDRPFESYLFIYHFPRGPAGGGMEHAYSTAIDHSARDLQDLKSLQSTSAHEFFHLWNVKRIRPQSLEPIDYEHENYTRSLWFSEGVTSTVADMTMLKAGLMTEPEFLQHVSSSITTLQSRPAHLTQSAEQSSLDAWLERYPDYRNPQRSVSYYNKGELLGILLDLEIRDDSRGRFSLHDLFQALNNDYAKQGKFFPDSDGVRSEAEKLAGKDLRGFFDKYVAGLDELPYERLFSTVGLTLTQQQVKVGDPGFSLTRNFNGPFLVEEVYGDQARSAGLREGDEVASIDHAPPGRNPERQFANLKPGTKVQLGVVSHGARKDVEITLGERSSAAYLLTSSPQANPEQLARRRAWLQSADQTTAGQ